MSKGEQARDARIAFWVTLAFGILVVGLSGLMGGYWFLQLEPRLRVEAEANARLIADNQAAALVEALSPAKGAIALSDLTAAIDRILLSTDPVSKRPYVLGLSLDLDESVLPIAALQVGL